MKWQRTMLDGGWKGAPGVLRILGLAAWLACGLVARPAAGAAPAGEDSKPATAAPSPAGSPTVGMEGRLEVTLPGTVLEARPVEHKARLVLRIAETRPRGEALWYDLRYIGFVPGSYDLRTNLVRLDGSPVTNLPSLPVSIAPLLPEQHDGMLIQPESSPLGRLGGYRTWMIAAGVVWALLFIPLVWRRRRKEAVASATPAVPTLADRLRPLVEQAAAGKLSADGQAQLERILLNYWREKLGLGSEDMAEALRRLRAHAEAGELLRALEGWLHRPPGSAPVNVATVLEPYRAIADPAAPVAAGKGSA